MKYVVCDTVLSSQKKKSVASIQPTSIIKSIQSRTRGIPLDNIGLIHRLLRLLTSNYGSADRSVPFLEPLSLPYTNQLANTLRRTTQTPDVCARAGQWWAAARFYTF